MEKLIDRIEQHWLEWESVPLVFAILLFLYVSLASELKDWVGAVADGMGYLLLAIPFALALVGYMIGCVVHNRKEEKRRAAVEEQQEDGSAADVEASPSKKRVWMVIGSCLSVIAIVFAVIVFSANTGAKDGSYVIWSQEYHVALSPEVVKNYYLMGDKVQAKGSELTDYTDRCVVELDFEKDGTFTISYDGRKLGVVPGQNGVGYRDDCTSNVWMLEEAGDGVYYIKNVGDETYLKWFVAKDNWTTHPNIVDDNREQYLLYLTPVK